MKPVEAPVSETLILICEKCGKTSRDLQQELKKEIKDSSRSKQIRAVITGCMKVCPKDQITVALARTDAPTQYFTIDEKTDAADLLDQINELHS